MPVNSENSVSGPYYPNGVTKSFRFEFKATSISDVIAVDAAGNVISPALYSVAIDNDDGGSLTFATAPSATEYPQIFVISDPALTQPSDFDNTGPSYNPASLTRALDRAAARDLKQQREIDRGLKMPFGEAGMTFPPASQRGNRFPYFGPAGDLLMSSGTGNDPDFRTDWADPDIGGLLGAFRQAGVGSVVRTIFAKLIENLSAADKGADATGVADSTTALQNLFADMATTGRANLLSGTYKVTQPLVIPPGAIEGGDVILDFRGADANDFKSGLNPDVPCVLVQGGARTKIANLSADLAIGDRQMVFVAPHGLAVGDTFNLSGTVDYAGNGARPEYHKGEMFRVAIKVDDTTIITSNACRDSYPAADVEVWKRSGSRFTMGAGKLTILAPDTIMYPLMFESIDGLTMDNVRVEGGAHTSISLLDCFEAKGQGVYARQVVNTYTDGYGIGIFNCQDVRLRGTAHGYVNGITTGGGLTTGGRCGMNRDVHFEGIGSSHPTGGLAGAQTHGNTEYSSFRGYFSNGVQLCGNWIEAHGVFTKVSGFSPVQVSEMHGHSFTITGEVNLLSGPDLPTTHGAIGSGTMIGPYLRYGGTSIIDCRIRATKATRLLVWRPLNLARTDLVLRLGLDVIVGHPTTRLIWMTKSGGNDFPVLDIMRLNNIDTAAAISWSMNSGTKIRGMKQSKSVTVTGTSVATATQALTFDPPFPRTPVINANLASNVVNGTVRQTTGLSALSASGCTVQVSGDGTNMNFNATVGVTASLDE